MSTNPTSVPNLNSVDIQSPTITPQVPIQPILTENKRPFFLWLAILLFLTLFAATGYLFWQNQQLRNQLATSTTSLTPSPTSTTDPTAGWQTYTSDKYNFSFRYPENSVIKLDTLNSDGSLEFNNFILYIEKTNDTLINYATKLTDNNFSASPTPKMIGVLPTVEWMGFFKNAPVHYMSISNNGYIYNLGITPLDDTTNFIPDNTSFMSQILSTFKFTDPTAGWKTYTNSEFSFSFRYPSTWKDITDEITKKSGNREVTLLTDNQEYVVGTVFDAYDNTFVEKPWIKQFKLSENKSVLMQYVTDIGEGSQGGQKDLEIFDQILSTFKFTN